MKGAGNGNYLYSYTLGYNTAKRDYMARTIVFILGAFIGASTVFIFTCFTTPRPACFEDEYLYRYSDGTYTCKAIDNM